MATTRHSTMVGVFPDRAHAEQALNELHNLGFRDEQIGYVVRGDQGTEGKGVPGGKGSGMAESAAIGAAGGGITGGLLGAGASLLIPGIGPAIAGGILAATLGGAAIGAATGGLTGALMKMGIPENEARYYQSEFEAGHPVVTVNAADRQRDVAEVFRRHGARDMTGPDTGEAASRGPQMTDPGGRDTMSNVSRPYGQGVERTPYGPTVERNPYGNSPDQPNINP